MILDCKCAMCGRIIEHPRCDKITCNRKECIAKYKKVLAVYYNQKHRREHGKS